MSHKKKKMKKKIIKRKVFYQSQMNINCVVEGAFGARDGSLVCIDGRSADSGNLTPRVSELRYHGCLWLTPLVTSYFRKGNEWLEENEVTCLLHAHYFAAVDAYFTQYRNNSCTRELDGGKTSALHDKSLI